ncbi:hypothetical protein SARC_11557 [Sphaeroforma arctica JP610]|uniref:Pentacotripeptide-repeat region of PRORP domain-containing protein n=1 Tax=Sphaeroforma arctica JP610 TaxID=667725 RepID=A0A0L0FIR4_9EUKA|nr:hypothetical protein SARC_11557 [Sphaeroforma arctica JP610]KNC75928.1 hypothetical protein SARC_11557 [Sphaeroforma arctica JP610]|eukprot:XP_014149830.1 hypothetical protein SARC_11557 [Sphaeroforma arctica JP610]
MFDPQGWSRSVTNNVYNSAVCALSLAGDVSTANALRADMASQGLVVSLEAYRSLMYVYGQLGRPDDAEALFTEYQRLEKAAPIARQQCMVGRESAYHVYEMVVQVLLQHGHTKRAMERVRELAEERMTMTPARVVSMLRACEGQKSINIPVLLSDMAAALKSDPWERAARLEASTATLDTSTRNTNTDQPNKSVDDMRRLLNIKTTGEREKAGSLGLTRVDVHHVDVLMNDPLVLNTALQLCYINGSQMYAAAITRSMKSAGIMPSLYTYNVKLREQLRLDEVAFDPLPPLEVYKIAKSEVIGWVPDERLKMLVRKFEAKANSTEVQAVSAAGPVLGAKGFARTLQLYQEVKRMRLEPNSTTLEIVAMAHVGMRQYTVALDMLEQIDDTAAKHAKDKNPRVRVHAQTHTGASALVSQLAKQSSSVAEATLVPDTSAEGIVAFWTRHYLKHILWDYRHGQAGSQSTKYMLKLFESEHLPLKPGTLHPILDALAHHGDHEAVSSAMDICEKRGLAPTNNMYHSLVVAIANAKPTRVSDLLKTLEDMHLRDVPVLPQTINSVCSAFSERGISLDAHVVALMAHMQELRPVPGVSGEELVAERIFQHERDAAYSQALNTYLQHNEYYMVDVLFAQYCKQKGHKLPAVLEEKVAHVYGRKAYGWGVLDSRGKKYVRFGDTEQYLDATKRALQTAINRSSRHTWHSNLERVHEQARILATVPVRLRSENEVEREQPLGANGQAHTRNLSDAHKNGLPAPTSGKAREVAMLCGKALECHHYCINFTASMLGQLGKWEEALGLVQHVRLLNSLHAGVNYSHIQAQKVLAAAQHHAVLACTQAERFEDALRIVADMQKQLGGKGRSIWSLSNMQNTYFAGNVVTAYRRAGKLSHLVAVYAQAFQQRVPVGSPYTGMGATPNDRGVGHLPGVQATHGEHRQRRLTEAEKLAPINVLLRTRQYDKIHIRPAATDHQMKAALLLADGITDARADDLYHVILPSMAAGVASGTQADTATMKNTASRVRVLQLLVDASMHEYSGVARLIEETKRLAQALESCATSEQAWRMMGVPVASQIHTVRISDLRRVDIEGLFDILQRQKHWSRITALRLLLSSPRASRALMPRYTLLDAFYSSKLPEQASQYISNKLDINRETLVALDHTQMLLDTTKVCWKHAAFQDVLNAFEVFESGMQREGFLHAAQESTKVGGVLKESDTAPNGSDTTRLDLGGRPSAAALRNSELGNTTMHYLLMACGNVPRRDNEHARGVMAIASRLLHQLRLLDQSVGSIAEAQQTDVTGIKGLVEMFAHAGTHEQRQNLCYYLMATNSAFKADTLAMQSAALGAQFKTGPIGSRHRQGGQGLRQRRDMAKEAAEPNLSVKETNAQRMDALMRTVRGGGAGASHTEDGSQTHPPPHLYDRASARWQGLLDLTKAMVADGVLPTPHILTTALYSTVRSGRTSETMWLLDSVLKSKNHLRSAAGAMQNGSDARKRLLYSVLAKLSKGMDLADELAGGSSIDGAPPRAHPSGETTFITPLMQSIPTVFTDADMPRAYDPTQTRLELPSWVVAAYDISLYVCEQLLLAGDGEAVLQLIPQHGRTGLHYGRAIRLCAKTGEYDRALGLYEEMNRLGIRTDQLTYNSVLHTANQSMCSLDYCKDVLDVATRAHTREDSRIGLGGRGDGVTYIAPTIETCSVLIKSFAQAHRLDEFMPYLRGLCDRALGVHSGPDDTIVSGTSDTSTAVGGSMEGVTDTHTSASSDRAVNSDSIVAQLGTGSMRRLYKELFNEYAAQNELHKSVALLDDMKALKLNPSQTMYTRLFQLCKTCEDMHVAERFADHILSRAKRTTFPVVLYDSLINTLGGNPYMFGKYDLQIPVEGLKYAKLKHSPSQTHTSVTDVRADTQAGPDMAPIHATNSVREPQLETPATIAAKDNLKPQDIPTRLDDTHAIQLTDVPQHAPAQHQHDNVRAKRAALRVFRFAVGKHSSASQFYKSIIGAWYRPDKGDRVLLCESILMQAFDERIYPTHAKPNHFDYHYLSGQQALVYTGLLLKSIATSALEGYRDRDHAWWNEQFARSDTPTLEKPIQSGDDGQLYRNDSTVSTAIDLTIAEYEDWRNAHDRYVESTMTALMHSLREKGEDIELITGGSRTRTGKPVLKQAICLALERHGMAMDGVNVQGGGVRIENETVWQWLRTLQETG